MTSPDFRTFVGTLIQDHSSWLQNNPSPTGTQFFDHYAGDPINPYGLLWRYEAWRSEHGYTRVRPWNGSEPLGRVSTVSEIPSPGRVLPWIAGTEAGPLLDARLTEGRTTVHLQTDFGTGPAGINALGQAIIVHWDAVRNFPTPRDSEIQVAATAPYSIRFWGFMKWASILRNRLLGIPVFAIPIVYDADGVPLSDIEYMDVANRWHRLWHGGATPCVGNTTGLDSSFGQFCSRFSTSSEFLRFHRDLLNIYDDWRRRAGMPKVERWKPPELHFHPTTTLPEVELSEDTAVQYQQIKDRVMHFNTLDALAEYTEGALHGAGHAAPESEDIADINTNNYSPRFMAWHHWIDYLWEVRQPRFDMFKPVASDETEFPGILTITRPIPNPDQIQPNNAVKGPSLEGLGSLWVKYRVRPESWGRDVNLSITGQVFRNSSDTVPVAGLDATPIQINAVRQGVEVGPIEVQFGGLDSDGEGAFAKQTLSSGAVGFKNGRIRITGGLAPVGNIPASQNIGAANDQFDHVEHIDTILVKETRPPVVNTLLNKSAFSVDEVTINARGAAQSAFPNSIFIVAQDPPEPPLVYGSSGILPQSSDRARTAVSGIFADINNPPSVEVVDESGTNVVNWFAVVPTDVFKEQPSLHDNATQRVLFRYLVIFDVNSLSTFLPNPGDTRYAYLRISAQDRSGNRVQNVLSPAVKLFRDANPYMIDVRDQNPAWLSIDARVFSVKHNEFKFGHQVSTSGSPNQYIADVIGEFNAGRQNFETIPSDHNQAALELAPEVSGERVYNFALARVRIRTTNPVSDVRVFFRLFTTALSNCVFNATNYPTSVTALPIALLGRTSPGSEIVSIPFFASPRVETRDTMPGATSMAGQTDSPNLQTFAASQAGGETLQYFGAHLDINSDTPRYPAAPTGDGPFPTPECVSVRNILRGQHQCMVSEVYYAGDPTIVGTDPGTSDNLAQRNLLIVETANPGLEATHTVQHSFDIVLPNRSERDIIREEMQRTQSRTLPRVAKSGVEIRHVKARAGDRFSHAFPLPIENSSPAILAAQDPRILKDPGFDELLFFWNTLPRDSRVDVYIPSIDLDYVTLLRRLRGTPETVRLVGDHTLTLAVDGVSFLPLPNLGLERLAGLITVRLPPTVKDGETYTVDVLQVRAALGKVVGGFRLTIAVKKAAKIYDREARMLDVFQERLKHTRPENRWYPILSKQVEYFQSRATSLAKEVADSCLEAPPEGKEGVRLRVILEKIRIIDFHGPLVHGSGEVGLTARVMSTNAGGIGSTTKLPPTGTYAVLERPEGHTIEVNREIFRGTVADNLTVEVFSSESEELEHRCYYKREFKGKAKEWLRAYRPSDQKRDPENVGDWQVWYRVEEA